MRWGLQIEAPFGVALTSGTVTVPVLLRDFGAKNGMLLVTDYEAIASHADELVEWGFGYSCLPQIEASCDPVADDETVRAMLTDWGWSGKGPTLLAPR